MPVELRLGDDSIIGHPAILPHVHIQELSLGGDACRELEVLQASPRCQVPQGGDQSLLRSDGLPHAGTLPADIGGQQSQQMVKYGVRHLEKVPEIIRIILTDLTEQRHMTELVTLEQPILGP
ncbi:hypothetical protein AB205_0013430 [Aquarana catesbeiana]|uniref:Uncharacterized protein n=1 Tax=Aquarana catesbeiana TaxID=8400 RepID=A0A2G9Q9J8_AQUCT|nr:hypothetical protein AB205_0013430 [Aquarana catesbeiana]